MFEELFKKSGRGTIAGTPPGADAVVLGQVAQPGRVVLHVARDDARMAVLAESLAFFHPGLRVLSFPAWDCLPYDRVSPASEVVARRLDTLTTLARTPLTGPCVVLTTVNAATQRVPARAGFANAVFAASIGLRIDMPKLLAFLNGNGYRRTDTVREPGEFAVRGGIVDLFPPGTAQPLRIDLFGDQVEEIRAFDPMTQLSAGKLKQFDLKPVSEVVLDQAAVSRFRTGYRELFGAVGDDDRLYEAVSAGQRYGGVEHWLPLFHERLETLFDYLPGAVVTLDHQADEMVSARFDLIAEYYEARSSLMRGRRGEADGPPYRPVPPEQLYFAREEWQAALDKRATVAFSPFAAPDDPAARTVDAGGHIGADFSAARSTPSVGLFDAVKARIAADRAAGRTVAVAAYSAGSRERLGTLFKEHGIEDIVPADGWAAAQAAGPTNTALIVLGLERGFTLGDLAVITEQDILGERLVRAARRRIRPDNFLTEVGTLHEGDLVVHVDHGIGRYDGLATLDVAGAPHDCLRLIYAGGDKLFVPVENIDVLSRYGSEDAGAELDKLGGVHWQARKARVKERIAEIAHKLIAIAAERQLRSGDAIVPAPGLFHEFCARFAWPETEDQSKAIDETLEDLGSGKPMDRLICGDVGFGKTEVALRAAFTVAMGGQQVAVVVPTTLLARQHFRTFKVRFEGLPVKVAQLSRLVTPQEATQTRRDVEAGSIDIVVGTTAMLGKSVKFKNLGLMIVDEEQHFGVAQKERLKEMRSNVHILTLTATPIPRTLQLALAGVRDMSIIASPPVDRLAVRTFVMPYDPVVLREAILRERFRGGQVFYVCPRIEDLKYLRERLSVIVPECRIEVAHGRLTPVEIEGVMTRFYDGGVDILLSTNIVESGLDIPTANTIIIHRADMFGLAQLYQLRGRVGRSKIRAYAYLTVPQDRLLTPTAQKRLEVMQTLDSLGAGFQLASYDLDIRGAGNLLGEEQSGHIREVGIELYQQMLEDAVIAAREAGPGKKAAAETWSPQISIGTPVLIPEAYVEDLGVRLGLYRRLAALESQGEVDAFATELADRFGTLPPEVENLLQIIAIKQLCRAAGVEKIDAGPKGAVVGLRAERFQQPAKLVAFINAQQGTVKLRPDQKLVYLRAWDDPRKRLAGINRLLNDLVKIAA